MYIRAKITECDISQQQYASLEDGAYALARGATGRWCPVLSVGPDAIREQGLLLLDVEAARAIIEAKGDWLDY